MPLTSCQLCSRFTLRNGRRTNVLIIGAERWDEFKDAELIGDRSHRVIVANPRETAAAKQFLTEGGSFIRSTIERLPAKLGPFDLIRESYPYTVGRVTGVCDEQPCPMWLSRREVRAYAVARLKHLAPNGRWIVFTESPGFACALRSIGRNDEVLWRHFNVRFVRLPKWQAPPSSYPHLTTRFKLIFQRLPVKRSRAMDRLHRKTRL
jgi:hypothetical protein